METNPDPLPGSGRPSGPLPSSSGRTSAEPNAGAPAPAPQPGPSPAPESDPAALPATDPAALPATARQRGDRYRPDEDAFDALNRSRLAQEAQLGHHIDQGTQAMRILDGIDRHLRRCLFEVLEEVLAHAGHWRIEEVRSRGGAAPWSEDESGVLQWVPPGLEVSLHRTSPRTHAPRWCLWDIDWPASAPAPTGSAPPARSAQTPAPSPPRGPLLRSLHDDLAGRPHWHQELRAEFDWQWSRHFVTTQRAHQDARSARAQFESGLDAWKSAWAQLLLAGRVVRLENQRCHFARQATRWPLPHPQPTPPCSGLTLPKPRTAGWQVREFRVQATLRAGSTWRIYGIRETFDDNLQRCSSPFETNVAPGVLLDALAAYLLPWPAVPIIRGF